MWTNLSGKFRTSTTTQLKELKDFVWNAARSTYHAKLEHWLEEIEKKYPTAKEWLNERPCEQWSRAGFSKVAKCDILLNNLSECFNKYVLTAREKPIITMLEMIRSQLMKRLNTKQILAKKFKGDICPKIKKKLAVNKELSYNYQAEFAGSPKVQVIGPDGQFVVDMEMRTCDCRRWDLTGIPCHHACACIIENNEQSENYVDTCYSVQTYNKVYANVINPTNGPTLWEKVKNPPGIIIAPSPVNTKRGPKVTARRKEAAEQVNQKEKKKKSKQKMKLTGVITIKCSVCGQLGHNKRHHNVSGVITISCFGFLC